ncbi:TorF family putative porin [Altererythrobacter sp.]|uniref:TorF family putative porin n=1 Tax=Altererythrobacter sp. TaxID=1872480 RepID=UPI003D037A57
MLTSIRGLTAATLVTGLALSAAPAFAETVAVSDSDFTVEAGSVDTSVALADIDLDRAIETINAEDASHMDGESGFTASANVALTTDYRFRGVSLSAGDMAIQGGFDISHSSGLYVGTWASSIEGGGSYGEMELDIYGGWSGDLAEGVSFDIGLLYYMYPTDGDAVLNDYNVNYWEPYASLGFSIGPASATVGVAYAWDQSSLGDEDNLYLYTDLEFGIPDTPLTLSGHLGYTDGVLAPPLLAGALDDTGLDWSIGASASLFGPLSVSVSYIGVEGPSIDGFTDDTLVATLSASF